MTDIVELLQYAVKNQCSDLHLSSGDQPIVRKNGELSRLDYPQLTMADIKEMIASVVTDEQNEKINNTLEYDFSFAMPKVARFRANVFRQSRGISVAIRTLSLSVPTLESTHLDLPVFEQICKYPNGLILITGATGSGKSTTLAALINHINLNIGKNKHILTIEDPVEYLFKSHNCLIQQREIGRDSTDFNVALKSALREDPDIIMVGEMRDLETIRLELTAAETGHLVFATLHTNSAPSAIDRIVDVFPGNEKEMIREMLAESLRAVITQRLLKTPMGGVRPAHEVLVSTGAVRNLIRQNKLAQLYSMMQSGKQHGMQTLEQHVDELLAKNAILPISDIEIKRDF